jgi:hypothetical protein
VHRFPTPTSAPVVTGGCRVDAEQTLHLAVASRLHRANQCTPVRPHRSLVHSSRGAPVVTGPGHCSTSVPCDVVVSFVSSQLDCLSFLSGLLGHDPRVFFDPSCYWLACVDLVLVVLCFWVRVWDSGLSFHKKILGSQSTPYGCYFWSFKW